LRFRSSLVRGGSSLNQVATVASTLAAGHWAALTFSASPAWTTMTSSGSGTNPGGALTFACKCLYQWEERGLNVTHGGPRVLYFGAGHGSFGGFGGGGVQEATAGGGAGPFNITGSSNVVYIGIDGGTVQQITIATGSARTTTQVATDINNGGFTGGTASVNTLFNNALLIRSNTKGTSSQVQISTGPNDAGPTLQLSPGTYSANPETKFIEYNLRDNVAREHAATSFSLFDATHSYGFLALAPGARKMYVGQSNSWAMFQVNLDYDDLASLSNSDWDNSFGPVGGQSGAPTQRTSMEWFPERQSVLFYADNGTPGLWEKAAGQSWAFYPLPALTSVTDGGLCCYNHVQKCVIVGGGSNGGTNNHWYKITTGTIGGSPGITQLDDAPVIFNSGGYTLLFYDPIGGKYCFIRANQLPPGTPNGYLFYELDVTASHGSQWFERTDLEAAIPQLGGTSNTTDPCVVTTLWDYGVALFMTGTQILLYKHTDKAVDADKISWTMDATRPGTCSQFQLNTQAELNTLGYSWNSLDQQLTAQINALGVSVNQPLTLGRNSGEAYLNATAQYSDTIFTIPHIAADITPPSGNTGYLRFDIPNHSAGNFGQFTTPYFKTLGLGPTPGVWPAFWSGSKYGAQIYCSYRYYVDSGALGTFWAVGTSNDYAGFGVGTIDHTVSGGRQVFASGFNASSLLVGRIVAIQLPESDPIGAPTVQRGLYTVASVEDAQHFTLTTSPLTNPGVNGTSFRFGASSAGTQSIQGFKVSIDGGEPPFGNPSGTIETTIVNQQQLGFPDLYGYSGSDSPTGLDWPNVGFPPSTFPQNIVPWVAGQWATVIKRMQPILPSFTPVSFAELWYGFNRCRRWTHQKISHSTDSGQDEGMGFGQTYLLNYMTGKDGAQNHTPTFMGYAQLVISTEPPSGLDVVAGTPTPPPPTPGRQVIPFLLTRRH
jgi:hypothetical protein